MQLFSANAIVFGPANMKKRPHNGPTNLFHIPGRLPKSKLLRSSQPHSPKYAFTIRTFFFLKIY